ncbi:MAG: glycosyl hydrolase [Flavisolibacter sp.]|nr:glycosyl hydrolase [Flavisolibacter sp.]
MRILKTIATSAFFISVLSIQAQKKPITGTSAASPVNSALFNGLQFRSLGPAIASGRIGDLAVNPKNYHEYYVAVASGGVWKTTNNGVTFTPVFDKEGSYSIGCITMDPNNSSVVWVGSGENNNQRSVAYGDGVYKTEDGGRSWKNVGLKNSEHIGQIVINPTNSDIVYVAAYGPLWSSGGDRGIYKTTDGGKTWKNVLSVSEHTGFNEIHMDPRDPDVLYAAAHQRQRKVFTYIGGGPESAIYKSTDGGNTWNKIMSGMPAGDIGRIGMAISPAQPDVVYAIVEAREGGGVYRSNDRGASWQKQGTYTSSGNYYQEIFCDPKNVDKLYAMNAYMVISTDGGKNFKILGEKNKHIDNHAMWINPTNTDHFFVGSDGGLYETFDGGVNWHFKPNLPVTQFYKVSTDNAYPFYHIHGGTQDNFSIGGPSRTLSGNGIFNSDWYFTSIGDGFETQVDQTNPDLIYAQSQYGGLVRYDRKTGEMLNIKPVEQKGEAAYRWNWDAPLLISQFDNKRLYFASNKVFRTDDRGNSWKVISDDLTSKIDRNKLPVMGKVWSVDAVAKNGSTDIFGNITTLAESKLDEDVLYAGTDDGLIQVTTNGGKTWSRVNKIAGVPDMSYVHQVITSLHDKNTAYAAFNHHRYGDFRPYVYRTRDGGKTWSPIQSNLPARGSVYTIAEDHINPNLLFAGTEFGVFFTNDGGLNWVQLKAGLPTIAVRDIEIQRRENDLVLGTFGRGFYVLDDYTALRNFKQEDLQKQAVIYPVKDALMFIPSTPLAVRMKGFQGESFYTSPNPPVGAVFTYYLKDELKTRKLLRQESEKAKIEKGETVYYPSIDSLRLEDEQPEPHLLFTVTDDEGQVIRHIKTGASKGINRIVWDFRYPPIAPINFTPFEESFVFSNREQGYMALPGTYKVFISKFEDGSYTRITEPQIFKTVPLEHSTLPVGDRKTILAFNKQVAELYRATGAADQYRGELVNRLRFIKAAILETPGLSMDVSKHIFDVDKRLLNVQKQLNGDATLARREFETTPSINERIGALVYYLWRTTSAPTETFKQSYELVASEFKPLETELKAIGDEIKKIEKDLEKAGAPYTPGRLTEWRKY